MLPDSLREGAVFRFVPDVALCGDVAVFLAVIGFLLNRDGEVCVVRPRA